MIDPVRKTLWLVVAAATLVAQAVPQAWGTECERACCVVEDHGCCSSGPVKVPDSPCHCQLDARQDEPLTTDRGTSSAPDLLPRGLAVHSASREVPQALGVSREYVASSLAVPIRPVRILQGVWRN